MKLNIWGQKQKMIRTSKSSLLLPHSFVHGEKGSFCLLGPLRGCTVAITYAWKQGMVFRPLTGYTMAKGSYSRIFVGIVFRPLTGYTSCWVLAWCSAGWDSLPSPYGVYQQKHPKSNRKTPSQPDVFYKYNFIISYPPPKRNPLKQIRITFLVRIQPLSLAHSMVKLRLRTKALPLLPYFKRKASS